MWIGPRNPEVIRITRCFNARHCPKYQNYQKYRFPTPPPAAGAGSDVQKKFNGTQGYTMIYKDVQDYSRTYKDINVYKYIQPYTKIVKHIQGHASICKDIL